MNAIEAKDNKEVDKPHYNLLLASKKVRMETQQSKKHG